MACCATASSLHRSPGHKVWHLAWVAGHDKGHAVIVDPDHAWYNKTETVLGNVSRNLLRGGVKWPTPQMPSDDQDIFDFARRHLFSAVIGDVMDKIGLCRQLLPQQVQPLSPEMVVVGRAMPVTEQLLPTDFEETGSHQPFGLMFRALDDLKPVEI